MNREFEILNEKLNVLFEELMWLRQDFQRERHERETKELKYKVEDAQDKLNRQKEESRYIAQDLDKRRDCFRNIQQMFRVVEEVHCQGELK